MDMSFVSVGDILKEKHNIEMPSLDLFCESAVFRVLLWQPKGTIKFEQSTGFYCSDIKHELKAESFIRLAQAKSVSLAITPEYCFPYEIIKEIVNDTNRWPSNGKMWALSMEGISNNGFEDFIKALQMNKQIVVIADAFIDATKNDYVNSTMFIFKCSEKDKLVIVIQLKTTAAADKFLEFESTYLTRGKTIYLFHAHNNYSRIFCTFICSDVLNSDAEKLNVYVKEKNSKILIYNPQLNLSPNHDSFQLFRKRFLSYTLDSYKIITLNWASNTFLDIDSIDTNEKKIINGLSSFYKNSNNKNDHQWPLQAINANKGLSYNIYDNTTAWFFSPSEHCIEIVCSIGDLCGIHTAASNHTEPTANHFYSFEDTDLSISNQCILDWNWIDSTFKIEHKSDNPKQTDQNIYICPSNEKNKEECVIRKVDHLISSFFAHDECDEYKFENNCFYRTSLKLPSCNMTSIIQQKRQWIENVVRTVYDAKLPREFRGLANNFEWFFSDDYNIKSKNKNESNNEALIVFCKYNDEASIIKKIQKISKDKKGININKIIMYYPDYNGYKYYDKLYERDCGIPESSTVSTEII